MGWRRALVDSAKGAVYFVALGPPVGALAVVAVAVLRMAWESPAESLAMLPGMFGFALLAMMFSWALGLLPALATGLLVGPLRGRLRQWRWCLLAGAIGAAASGLALMRGALLGDGSVLAWVLLNLVPGFVAGTVVARLFAVRAPYPPAKLPPLPLRQTLPQPQPLLLPQPQLAPSGPPPAPQAPGIGESP